METVFSMDVLVVDSGARGHAEAWKIAQSPDCDRLWVAPGNAGMGEIAENTGLDPTDIGSITKFAKQNKIDLTVVTEDRHLEAGMVDALQAEGLAAFGPTQSAAQIEWSKVFAKLLAREERVPTASFGIFDARNAAARYLRDQLLPVFIKEDQLARGKGVHKGTSFHEINKVLKQLKEQGVFGAPGKNIVIEEELVGPEISLHAWCDGENYQMFPFAMQDHKAIYENDEGPMTGGMGVVAPVPGITADDIERLGEQFVAPPLRILARQGRPFKGVLYPGLKLTAEGPKLLEWNARPGDPEAQAWATLLDDDLLMVMMACVEGRLDQIREVKWRQAAAACLTLAAPGYPLEPRLGSTIQGLNAVQEQPNIEVFHYGTQTNGRLTYVGSGRVLSVVGVGQEGEKLESVLNRSYEAADMIMFNNASFIDEKPQLRRDIGQMAISVEFEQRVADTRHLF